MLKDRFGRVVSYLRISVTPQCNLRCIYCTTKNSRNTFSINNLLSNIEILRISRIAVSLGIKKIRLTGGEPLLRKDIVELVREIASIRELEDISLTTNGTLLKKFAEPLKEAGLKRINISLDTLDGKKFEKITNGIGFKDVMEGIEKAKKVGFEPIKINVVVMKDLNDDEIEKFVNFGIEENLIIRFIEYMPISEKENFSNIYVSRDEIIKKISHLIKGESFKISCSGEPSQYIPIKNGNKIGVISSVSHGFCDHCNRLRLTWDGFLRTCLTQDIEINVKDALRGGTKDSEIEELFKRAVLLKPEKGTFSEKLRRDMSQIGG